MMVVVRMSTSMNNLAAQEVVDEVINTLQSWTATLPFMKIVCSQTTTTMMVMARMSTSMNILAAQEVVDEVINTLQSWTATLPFMDVEGIGTNGQPVDLFSYTSSHKKLPEGIGGPPPEEIFDRNKYPPTEQGPRYWSSARVTSSPVLAEAAGPFRRFSIGERGYLHLS
jgi:hypothetical protein